MDHQWSAEQTLGIADIDKDFLKFTVSVQNNNIGLVVHTGPFGKAVEAFVQAASNRPLPGLKILPDLFEGISLELIFRHRVEPE